MMNTRNIVMPEEEKMSFSDFVRKRLQIMDYCFTKEEAMAETGQSYDAFRKAVSRKKKASELIRPRNGFYVIVPPQYQRRGTPPATYFIHELMEYLERSYYVGLLTAASMYGAAHHAPQEFQVIAEEETEKITIENLRIVFIQNTHMEQTRINNRNTEIGTIRVSSPESTALDLVYYDDRSGHLDNVATVLSDLTEQLDSNELLDVSKNYHSRASVQRLGYILEFLGEEECVEPLRGWIASQDISRVPLSTHHPRSEGDRYRPWDVIVNVELQPE